jgi:glycosyltransferase involved in cell wall biosynthesis
VHSETAAWDLFLQVEGLPTALRLGSRLDDVANKKMAVAFPRFQMTVEGRGATAEPFYTVANNLSVRVAAKPVAQAVEQPTGVLAKSEPKQHTPLSPRGKALTGALLTVLEAAGRRRRTSASVNQGRPKVHFVITHVYGMGGTIRTVLNIANHLAEDHDVEIISAVRTRDKPFFPIDPRVRVTTLLDETKIGPSGRPRGLRGRIRGWLDSKTSWLVHDEDYAFQRYSLWLDLKLLRKLHSTRSGVLVTTRPSLNVIAARFAHPNLTTIGQEHLNAGSHGAGLLRQIEQHYRKVAALAVLTEGDEQDYRRMLRGAPTRIARIGNALPETPSRRADLASKRVIAAGRYTSQKGFDLLIPAFAQVADKHPDWQLRIFGGGRQLRKLRRIVAERGLYKHVLLMGQTDQLSHEMAKSSIYVLSSRFEGFGMVIIEAMSHGMGVVSFDCPRGPSDIITHGVDGTLVPALDIDRLAAGIIELIEDEDKRRSYAEAALSRSKSYSIEVIGDQWRSLFRELARTR